MARKVGAALRATPLDEQSGGSGGLREAGAGSDLRGEQIENALLDVAAHERRVLGALHLEGAPGALAWTGAARLHQRGERPQELVQDVGRSLPPVGDRLVQGDRRREKLPSAAFGPVAREGPRHLGLPRQHPTDVDGLPVDARRRQKPPVPAGDRQLAPERPRFEPRACRQRPLVLAELEERDQERLGLRNVEDPASRAAPAAPFETRDLAHGLVRGSPAAKKVGDGALESRPVRLEGDRLGVAPGPAGTPLGAAAQHVVEPPRLLEVSWGRLQELGQLRVGDGRRGSGRRRRALEARQRVSKVPVEESVDHVRAP